MKHGHKAKAAKTKTLGKERTAKAGKAPGKKSVKASGAKIPIAKKAAAKEASSKQAANAGKIERKGHAKGIEAVAFSSPAVASAFRRAVKKYGTALKRLTD